MKYIDAEKLIAKIERRKNESRELAQEHKNSSLGNAAQTIANEDEEILSLIDSLQQEQPEFVNEIWHKISEEANLTRPVVLSDGDKYMSPPCTFPFKDMSGFVKTMNKKYKANYTIWAYMNDLLNISSLQPEQPETDMKSPFTGGKVAILSREEEVTFRGEKVKIICKYYRCEDTGREFTDSKLDDDMMWAVFRAYCEKKGMTSFTNIMLKQEQPEVDLEKDIDAFFDKWDKNSYGCIFDENGARVNIETIKGVVKHFLNARKENIK